MNVQIPQTIHSIQLTNNHKAVVVVCNNGAIHTLSSSGTLLASSPAVKYVCFALTMCDVVVLLILHTATYAIENRCR